MRRRKPLKQPPPFNLEATLAELKRYQEEDAAQKAERELKRDKLFQELAEFREAERIRKSTPEGRRADRRLRTYGLSAEAFEVLFDTQGRKCAICRTVPWEITQYIEQWHVDHDHKTGRVRGILCRACNHGLGFFKDDIESLARAIEYLKRANDS